MARVTWIAILISMIVLGGCKTIEGGYDANKEKQNAKTDKIMNEGE